MTKKKKSAKKQAAQAKGQTPKGPPVKPKAPTAGSDGMAKRDGMAERDGTAKPTSGDAAARAPQSPAAATTSAKTLPPAKAPPRAAPTGDGAAGRERSASDPNGAPPSGGNNSQKKGSEKRPPENGVVPDSVSEAALPLQTFAVELQRMAKQSIEQTTDVLERLRDAKSIEEVVSLQTTFMQQSFRRYTDLAGRISQLMTLSQASLFQQGQAAMRSFRSIASGM